MELELPLYRNSDSFKQRFDMVIMAFAVMNAFCVPLSLAYNPPAFNTALFEILNFSIDFFFLIDIFMCFRTIVQDSKGNEEKRPREIAKIYLQG